MQHVQKAYLLYSALLRLQDLFYLYCSGSIEMNDQSSVSSIKDQSRGASIENENRTGSISSDEGLQSLPSDNKSPGSQKSSLKNRLFHKTPNTLSVHQVGSLGQSLPNLSLGSLNIGSGLSLSLHQNTLSVSSLE